MTKRGSIASPSPVSETEHPAFRQEGRPAGSSPSESPPLARETSAARGGRPKTVAYRIVTGSIKGIIGVLCRIDGAQLEQVPDKGPLILLANHINFLETPLLYTQLLPRPLTAFAKIESWDDPLRRTLFNLWGAIPLSRGEADVAAFRQALAFLERDYILAAAPEGTRSYDGRLGEGHGGVTFLALRSGAPLLPVAHYGGEHFWTNLRRMRRTDVHIAVGSPFYLDTHGERATQQVRRQMTTEIMYQMAALLPATYRGVYSDLSAATESYLRFSPGAESSLSRARS